MTWFEKPEAVLAGKDGMGVEIERKFLVVGEGWRGAGPSVAMRQGYLGGGDEATVRVRIAEDEAFLTVKGRARGMTRAEFEYPIPVADAEELLALCGGVIVEKVRTRVSASDVTWEVDEFSGDNAGLVTAECELNREDQGFVRPDWLGGEVTGDHRYANSNLARHPFSDW